MKKGLVSFSLSEPKLTFENTAHRKYDITGLVKEFRTSTTSHGLVLSASVANDIEFIDLAYEVDLLSM